MLLKSRRAKKIISGVHRFGADAEIGGVVDPGRFDLWAERIVQCKSSSVGAAEAAVDLALGLAVVHCLAERGQKLKAIFVVPEDVFALVSAIHDVINRSRILKAQVARHPQPLSATDNSVNSED